MTIKNTYEDEAVPDVTISDLIDYKKDYSRSVNIYHVDPFIQSSTVGVRVTFDDQSVFVYVSESDFREAITRLYPETREILKP